MCSYKLYKDTDVCKCGRQYQNSLYLSLFDLTENQ